MATQLSVNMVYQKPTLDKLTWPEKQNIRMVISNSKPKLRWDKGRISFSDMQIQRYFEAFPALCKVETVPTKPYSNQEDALIVSPSSTPRQDIPPTKPAIHSAQPPHHRGSPKPSTDNGKSVRFSPRPQIISYDDKITDCYGTSDGDGIKYHRENTPLFKVHTLQENSVMNSQRRKSIRTRVDKKTRMLNNRDNKTLEANHKMKPSLSREANHKMKPSLSRSFRSSTVKTSPTKPDRSHLSESLSLSPKVTPNPAPKSLLAITDAELEHALTESEQQLRLPAQVEYLWGLTEPERYQTRNPWLLHSSKFDESRGVSRDLRSFPDAGDSNISHGLLESDKLIDCDSTDFDGLAASLAELSGCDDIDETDPGAGSRFLPMIHGEKLSDLLQRLAADPNPNTTIRPRTCHHCHESFEVIPETELPFNDSAPFRSNLLRPQDSILNFDWTKYEPPPWTLNCTAEYAAPPYLDIYCPRNVDCDYCRHQLYKRCCPVCLKPV